MKLAEFYFKYLKYFYIYAWISLIFDSLVVLGDVLSGEPFLFRYHFWSWSWTFTFWFITMFYYHQQRDE